MGNIGPLELIVVLIIALVVLGPKRLPEVGRSVGKGMREFKDAINGDHHDDHDDDPPQITAVAVSEPVEHSDTVDTPAAEPKPEIPHARLS
jgi:sec-independent protein translocase protein TatA